MISISKCHSWLCDWADLGALSLLARDKVLGFVALIKDYAAIKGGAPTPVYHLLQPPFALHLGNQWGICPATTKLTLAERPKAAGLFRARTFKLLQPPVDISNGNSDFVQSMFHSTDLF